MNMLSPTTRKTHDDLPLQCRYFANLANISGTVQEGTEVPTREQLQLVIQRSAGAKTLSLQQIHAVCDQAGIQAGVVAQVAQAGRFESEVEVEKFMFLLLAMSCDSFKSVAEGLFELFGQELDSARFIGLIGYLAPDMDPDVTSQFLADLSTALIDTPTVTYDSILKLHVLETKLAA